MENERKFDAKEFHKCGEKEKIFDAGLIFEPRDIIIIKNKNNNYNQKKKEKKEEKKEDEEETENFGRFLGKTVQDQFQTTLSKPSVIADGFAKTVCNPNQRPIFLDGFKPSRKNRLDRFLDGFFQFLDGFKLSRNLDFFVVQAGFVLICVEV